MPLDYSSKSYTYRTLNLPGYDPTEDMCQTLPLSATAASGTMSRKQLKKAENWNAYQKNTWYQIHLNNLEREECPPGVQCEFRQPGVAETKVNLMETGKWRAWTAAKGEDLRDTWNQTMNTSYPDYIEENLHATTSPNISHRPHTSSTENRRPDLSLTHQSSLPSEERSGSAPPINPKTMFIPQRQTKIFGAPKDLSQSTAARPQASLGKSTVTFDLPHSPVESMNHTKNTKSDNNAPFSSNQFPDSKKTMNATSKNTSSHFDSLALTGSGLGSGSSTQSVRPMSSQALSRRHMGVRLETSQNRSHSSLPLPTSSSTLSLSSAQRNQLLTLKASNHLNHRAEENTLFAPQYHHPHPHSGYDRGLKGTLLLDDWREESLMKGDGKICFRPLSYDVLETLTYGPPDPSKKMAHELNFPPLPQNRLSLVKEIFSCLLRTSRISPTNSSSKTVTVETVVQNFDPSVHPAVKSGRVTEDQVLQGMIFDMLGEEMYELYGHYTSVLSRSTSWEEFELHYRAVSSVIFRDEYFDSLLRSTWRKYTKDLSKNRAILIGQYSNRVDTADFESVMKSTEKKKK